MVQKANLMRSHCFLLLDFRLSLFTDKTSTFFPNFIYTPPPSFMKNQPPIFYIAYPLFSKYPKIFLLGPHFSFSSLSSFHEYTLQLG